MRSALLLLLAVVQVPQAPKPPDLSLVRAVLVTEKSSYFLGEQVPIQYCLDNISNTIFTAHVAGVPQLFKPVVTDERGIVMPGPGFGVFVPDVLFSPIQIRPEERYCESFQLMNYVRIDNPGVYSVATPFEFITPFILGNSTPRPKVFGPEARMTLTFRTPSKAEAEKVVASMRFSGFPSVLPAILLDPLLNVVRQGNVDAIRGIGAIPTPDATQSLIRFLDDTNPIVVSRAAEALTFRMPAILPSTPGMLGGLGSRPDFASGWSPKLAPELRMKARKLLKSSDESVLRAGSFFLASIGEPEDIPDVTAAMNRVNVMGRSIKMNSDLNWELTRAAEGIVGRGYVPPTPSNQAGDQIVWLVAFGRGARPSGWEAILVKTLDQPLPYVQRAALTRLPNPLPSSIIASVARTFAASDPNVLSMACDVVASHSITALRSSAMDVFKKTYDPAAYSACGSVVYSLGPRMEYYDVLIARLSDGAFFAPSFLDSLLEVFDGASGGRSVTAISAAEALRLSQRWRTFIDGHRTELEAGRKLSFDDPAATAELVPMGWILNRTDGKPPWPAR